MNLSPTAPKRPALRYFGGKFLLAEWVISHFPPHDHYVEPCFGAGNVLLCKPMVKLETVNDLNGRVTNYFKMLRDRTAELIRAIDLTPWSQDEYTASQETADNPLEDARRFHVLCWMSINGGASPTGFRTQNSLAGRYATPATDLINHDLWTIARRIKNVQITNVPAEKMLMRYRKEPDVLIYFDPPYLQSERVQKSGYGDYEVDVSFHVETAETLRTLPGMVVVSGKKCALYTELFECYGWPRVDIEARSNGGEDKTESLWLSPRTYRALHRDFTDLPIFSLSEARP